MDDNHYKIDKLSIVEQQQVRASEALDVIEKKSEGAPVTFLKANYGNTKIRERSKDIDFKMMLSIMLTKICGYAGIKSEVSDFDAGDISRMILSSYNDLTLEEVYKAFELERYGSYDEKTEHYQLFNAEYVSSVLKKYKTWKQNTKMQHNIGPSENQSALPEITESQKKEIIDKGIVRVFNEFKETGVMPEPCVHIFDELYERKIIRDASTPGEQAYYQRMYQQAADEIEKELNQANVGSLGELRTIREELERISQNNSDKVIVRSKKLILSDYFTRQIKNNVEIENILK